MATGFFFLVVDFKIFSLSNFKICDMVLLTLVAMLYIISVWLIDFIARSLYLFYSFSHFATPPPTPGNQLICSLYL